MQGWLHHRPWAQPPTHIQDEDTACTAHKSQTCALVPTSLGDITLVAGNQPRSIYSKEIGRRRPSGPHPAPGRQLLDVTSPPLRTHAGLRTRGSPRRPASPPPPPPAPLTAWGAGHRHCGCQQARAPSPTLAPDNPGQVKLSLPRCAPAGQLLPGQRVAIPC